MNYNFNDDDIKLVEKFIEIRNKGYYCDGAQVTDVYNRILNKRVNPTQCGSCIRQRIGELENALNVYKRELEKEEQAKAEEMKLKMEKVRAARKTKKEKEG